MELDSTTATRSRVVFESSPMVGLLDAPVRYDLGESTCPALRVDEIGWGTDLATLDLGYGSLLGRTSLRTRIAADHGVGPDDVVLTTGSAGAMHLIAQDRCHGRTVLLTPCYPPALLVPEGLGSPVDRVRLRFEDGYRMRIDQVAAALRPDTTLVSLASPQNPSGIRFDLSELNELLAVMADLAPDAILLVDETYRASTYGADPVPPSAAALSPRVVTCSSVSKAHGAPGLRLGWLITTDAALRERLHAAKFAGMVTAQHRRAARRRAAGPAGCRTAPARPVPRRTTGPAGALGGRAARRAPSPARRRAVLPSPAGRRVRAACRRVLLCRARRAGDPGGTRVVVR